MQIPNEIILQIASHIPHSQSKTLSSLSRTSSSIYSLLSPLLYKDLELTQNTLVALLNDPSDNFRFVKSITLTHIWLDFSIDHTKSLTSLDPDHDPNTSLLTSTTTTQTPDVDGKRLVFPNATTLKLKDTMDTALAFDPLPIMASLPKLLNIKTLILDVRHLSWRMRALTTLWPELEVLEMYTRNWTLPFTIPGIHHIIHIQNQSPFIYKPTSPWDLKKYGNGKLKPNPDEGYSDTSKSALMTMVRWMVNSIEACAIQQEIQGKGMSTWEVRVKNGGEREIEWAVKRVGDMLEMAGLGEGRVVGGEVDYFKIVVEE